MIQKSKVASPRVSLQREEKMQCGRVSSGALMGQCGRMTRAMMMMASSGHWAVGVSRCEEEPERSGPSYENSSGARQGARSEEQGRVAESKARQGKAGSMCVCYAGSLSLPLKSWCRSGCRCGAGANLHAPCAISNAGYGRSWATGLLWWRVGAKVR